ncbi:hypothetical protein NK983_34880, partial [Salmonella enterica subsp. enterica serovar Typhimurium]|nr:hypothetical protein [Salmonella enterica subsp. enterica serovar Typhimurium]
GRTGFKLIHPCLSVRIRLLRPGRIRARSLGLTARQLGVAAGVLGVAARRCGIVPSDVGLTRPRIQSRAFALRGKLAAL